MGQHVNTFNKGMTSDVSIVMQPDGTYRYLKNCQLISQDGNNYTIKDCLGNTRIFQINIPYATFNGVGPTITYQTAPIPIGFISFPDVLIVFSTNVATEGGGYGEIGKIVYDPYGQGIQPRAASPTNTYSGYVPLYHHVSLNFTTFRQIEGFGYEETETHKRVYWTDHLNEPRVFDIGNPIFTTYIASGSLVTGQQYMVLEGVITHGATVYGPDISLGNVFTATGAAYTDMFGGNIPTTAKVISYYPYQLLAFTPSRSVGNIKFNSYGAGTVLCGSKVYFYRLADPTAGLFTSWSYGSAPIHVGTTNSVTAVPANVYFNFTGGGTTSATLDSGKSVLVDITNIDTNFPRIQLAVAEYDQLEETPRQIIIVEDIAITGASMTLTHTGGTNLGDLTLDDITLFPASILNCKTITSNKGYILVGNLEERSEFSFDTTGITSAEIGAKFAVHEALETSCPNILAYADISPNPAANPAFIIAGHQYVVTATPVTYNAVVLAVGDVFIGVSGATAIVGAGSVRPCASRNRYNTTAGATVPDYIQFATGGSSWWTYKNPAVASHKLGYWSNEKYRFGILFYDLKGNPFYVRWITDFIFSNYNTTPIAERVTTAAYDYWFLKQKGISFSNIVITPAIADQISGFSIVRAERDKRIITEGLVMQCGANGTMFRPTAGINPANDSVWSTSVNAPKFNYYTFISPDNQVGFPMPNYASGSNLEGGFFLDPTDYTGGGALYMKSVDESTQFETRYILPLTADLATRKEKIKNILTVNEGGIYLNFGNDNFAYWNFTQFGLVSSTIDNSCVGGLGSTANPDRWRAVAGRRTVVELESFLYDYTPILPATIAYGDLASVGLNKLVIDVTVDKPIQYGGLSDTAKANTLYISTGHFQPMTAAVKAQVLSGGNYVFNNVEIWGGDCFTSLIDYGHSLYDPGTPSTSPPNPASLPHSWGIKFPCQCNTNYDLRRGRTVANNKMYATTIANGVSYNPLRLEGYSYNQGYSTDGQQFAYPALPVNFPTDTLFKTRTRFAGEKFIGELNDSFRTFLINDRKDLNVVYGEINNLVSKDDKTIVFQNHAISTVPIQERQLLSGLSGAETTLGTGGVVDRYDAINTYFGNQHQHGMTKTENGFVWFDMRQKAIVEIRLNEGLWEVTKATGLAAHFSEAFIDNLGNTVQTQPINSPDFSETADRPIAGVGLTGWYDPKFKMTYLTFKFKNYPSADKPLAKDFTIGYYHTDKVIIGFFDVTPAIAHNHNQIVVMSKNPQNKTKFYGAGMASTDFVLGDIVADTDSEYMCTTAGNVAAYASPPSGSLFTKINTTNEVWVMNQPLALAQSTAPDYLYNKVFGQVIDNEIHFVVNPQTAESFDVTNMEQQGNNVYPTTVTIEAGSQTATETVRTTSVNYKYIWDKLCHNLPSSSTGRIVNKHLLVKLIKKNWTTNPTTLTGAVKILQWVKSYFTLKR